MKIDIRYDDAEVRRGLNRLLRASRDLSPAMREIAGHLVDSASENLRRQAAPDGTPWAPLAERTLAERRRDPFDVRRILERSGDLFTTIQGEHGKRHAAAGTDIAYAAIHQFGGRPGMAPAPAAVPARPFLGVTDDHRDMILATIREHLRRAVDPG